MALRGIFFQELLLGALILAAAAATEFNPSCNRKCGSLSIPYPFGTSEDCYPDPSFLITCNHTFNPPKPFLGTGNIEVFNISLDGELRVSKWVARSCYNGDSYQQWFRLSDFLVSNTKNKLFAVGCNTVAYFRGRFIEKNFTTGCVSRCDSSDSVVNGSCDGVGCCQSSVPLSTASFNVFFGTLNNHVDVQSFNPCSFGFLAEEKAYKFSSLDLVSLQDREEVPLVLDWAVGNETCLEAKKNKTNYTCKAAHSKCYNFTNKTGYRCRCSSGYDGNPYLPGGCKDIDESKASYTCDDVKQCPSLQGSFKCACPMEYTEHKWRNETVCYTNESNCGSFAMVLSK